ncbi:MAG: penicillin-insensitive murein endopeptidase [Pseudomonadota bacterium]
MGLITLSLASHAGAQNQQPAKELFGAIESVDGIASSRAIGSYAKGCLVGGREIATDGPGWQTVRMSRHRFFGHEAMLAVLEDLAARGQAVGWNGLLIGDVAQPRGGPMLTGHRSHQIGLDADIWLTPMPEGGISDAGREEFSPPSMLVEGGIEADPDEMRPAQAAIIREAALMPEVARVFVHPGIKQAICDRAGGDRDWLGKVRPWWGHDRHFHIRLACPASDADCIDQASPPPGDGCGDELAWWFTDEPWQPSDKPPAPDLTLADLPAACAALVEE